MSDVEDTVNLTFVNINLTVMAHFCCLDVNECSSNPCKNGGSCKDGVNQYSCSCMAGYTGHMCQTGKCCILRCMQYANIFKSRQYCLKSQLWPDLEKSVYMMN